VSSRAGGCEHLSQVPAVFRCRSPRPVTYSAWNGPSNPFRHSYCPWHGVVPSIALPEQKAVLTMAVREACSSRRWSLGTNRLTRLGTPSNVCPAPSGRPRPCNPVVAKASAAAPPLASSRRRRMLRAYALKAAALAKRLCREDYSLAFWRLIRALRRYTLSRTARSPARCARFCRDAVTRTPSARHDPARRTTWPSRAKFSSPRTQLSLLAVKIDVNYSLWSLYKCLNLRILR